MTETHQEIAVITDTESLSVFKILPVDYFLVKEKELKSIFENVYNKKYKIIFITESIYEKCKQFIKKEKLFPVVTILPSLISQKQLGKINLSKLTKIATGTELG
ncbi:MAG: V-type ATP synthase subunit F [Elusimicrobiota bacterium]|nr:V-type ATP synthase subunit F [Elusimicrobiota bacterium]